MNAVASASLVTSPVMAVATAARSKPATSMVSPEFAPTWNFAAVPE